MSMNKPFYRTVRGMKAGPNAGYSGWGYIVDMEYAENPAQYTRALSLILNDLRSIFEFVEPSDEGKNAFSYRIHALLMRTCIEVEANFKAIFDANILSIGQKETLSMRHYRKIDATHHLSSYEVILPMWNGLSPTIRPFEPWHAFRGQATEGKGIPLPWYQAYNASKHSRQKAFKQANLWALIEAVAGLLILVTAQFKTESFDAGPTHLIASMTSEYHAHEHSIGDLFRIKHPDDWLEDDMYDFDWSILKSSPDKFVRFDYNSIPT